MSDNSVQGVGKVDFSNTNRSQVQEAQTDLALRALGAAGATHGAVKSTGDVPERKSQPIIKNLSDVRLKFQVDPETKDVTVLVLDKASKKVIRTIPPEDIRKLNEGELFELAS